MTATGEMKSGKPWYLKWWVIAIGAFLVIGIIGYALGGGRDAPTSAPTEPVDTPNAEPVVDSEPAPEPEPTSEAPVDAGPTDADRAEAFESALRASFGGQEYSDVFASDPSLWYGWITGVRVESGNAYVTLQVGSNDVERGDLGQRAASAIPRLLPSEAMEGIGWVIVEDASGVVIEQSRVG